MSLLETLELRFNKHPKRHPNTTWQVVLPLLTSDTLKKIEQLESTLGEPDVVELDGHLYMVDMSKESPKGRVSCCYDEDARLGRVKFPPETSALGLCQLWGVSLMDETMYRALQHIEAFDQKTSSWILTTEAIRELGGALFMDRRYNMVFLYHNGADSYYGSRGFRAYMKLT